MPVAMDNIQREIEALRRIKIGNLYIDKSYLGTEGLNLQPQELSNLQDQIILTLKAQKEKSISKNAVLSFWKSTVAIDTPIQRIRIEGKNERGDIIIDSFLTKKFDNIKVKLDSKGLVDDYSIFSRMEELFGIDE